MISHICFDADDTLWENISFFVAAELRVAEILAPFADQDMVMAALLDTERRNVPVFGYGAKSFGLSMVEAAIEISDGQVTAGQIDQILVAIKNLMAHPIEMPSGLPELLGALGETHHMSLITKGDLVDQNHKLDRSELRQYFDEIHVVVEKDAPTYRRIFADFGVDPSACLMVGNSMKSDVLPVLDVGGWGVFLPHDVTWELEKADPPSVTDMFVEIKSLTELPELLNRINAR